MGKPQRQFLTYRYTPCYATLVTFLRVQRSQSSASLLRVGDIFVPALIIISNATLPCDPMKARARLGVLMDPIGAIKYAKDSTLAMLLAAQARALSCPTWSSGILLLRDGKAFGTAAPLCGSVPIQMPGSTLGEAQVSALGELDCILMRKDPPFDTEYIYSTYILERAEDARRTRRQPPPGPARHEREGVHGLVSRVLCADAHHARHGRHAGFFARARQDRLQTARWHGGPLDLRGRA